MAPQNSGQVISSNKVCPEEVTGSGTGSPTLLLLKLHHKHSKNGSRDGDGGLHSTNAHPTHTLRGKPTDFSSGCARNWELSPLVSASTSFLNLPRVGRRHFFLQRTEVCLQECPTMSGGAGQPESSEGGGTKGARSGNIRSPPPPRAHPPPLAVATELKVIGKERLKLYRT